MKITKRQLKRVVKRLIREAYDEFDFATDTARDMYRHGREELEYDRYGKARAVGDRPEFLVDDMDDEVELEQLADELGISVRDLEDMQNENF